MTTTDMDEALLQVHPVCWFGLQLELLCASAFGAYGKRYGRRFYVHNGVFFCRTETTVLSIEVQPAKRPTALIGWEVLV